MDISVSNSSVKAQVSAPELAPAGVGTAEAAAKPLSDTVLTGPGVTVTTAAERDLADWLDALRKGAAPDKAKVLSDMMKSYFDTMMNMAKNLAPSEKELKLRERRKEDLKKQIRDLEAKKVTVEQAVIRFENTILAAADKDLLEANMAKQRQENV